MKDTIVALADSALRRRSGDVIWQRGKSCAASGVVEIFSECALPRPAAKAWVMGTHRYATEVWVDEEGDVDGDCECPNAADGHFCKHQVAVSIVWRHRHSGEAIVVDESSSQEVAARAKRAATLRDKRTALLEFLNRQDAPTLAAKLAEFADRDRSVSSDLQRWRKVAEASEGPNELRSLITELLGVDGRFLEWRDIHTYVRRAEAVLPPLRALVTSEPSKAVNLSLHALRRAWAALENADDSDGEIGGLCEAIGEEWVRALQVGGPHPAKSGETYLELQLEQPFDCFDAVAAEQAIGEPAMTRYRQTLATRWRAAKDAVLALRTERDARAANRKGRPPGSEQPSAVELALPALERLHLQQLEQEGRVDDAVAVLREDLSTAADWRGLVGYLDEHGRHREALTAVEQGLKAFPTDWGLQGSLLQCYERDGWTDEALALRRRRFASMPDVEGYHGVLEAARAAGRDVVALRQELLDWLAADELPARTGRAGRAVSPARNVTLRAAILCSEQRWLEASVLVEPPAECHERVLVDIAEHLPTCRHERAVALLLTVFDRAMAQSASPYDRELTLVAKILARLTPDHRAAWLAELRKTYKAKRNFVAGLARV